MALKFDNGRRIEREARPVRTELKEDVLVIHFDDGTFQTYPATSDDFYKQVEEEK